MSNSLIIGLGGTGGKIIREFRKRYFEEYKTFKPQDSTYIEYLYVDSDEGDLKTSWRSQGVSIGLSNAQKVSIHGMNLSDLDQLSDRPTLNGFIDREDVEIIKDKLGRVVSEGIAGQRRRLGRMLMASHNNLPEGFAAQLKGRVQSLQNLSKQQDVHFHIVAGLAGGTGSGSVIDAVVQIRELYGFDSQIHLYLYVPEQQTVYADNIEYYKANGYAALLELNAMSIESYQPVDISGKKDPFTGEAKRLKEQNPINGTYLFTNVNEKGTTLRLSDELPQMVGDFLFQKICIDKDSTNNERLRRIEKFENGDPTPEKDDNGNKVRSLRFLSFGFRRVIFPEEEIKEYLAYKLAERSALQMHYQKWTSQGFTSVSRQDATDDITMKTIQNDRDVLFLGNKILMRESSLPGTETVQEIYDSFKIASSGYSEQALQLDKEEWLNFYNGNIGAFYKKKFRRMGVIDYFSQETIESSKYARKIVNKIEETLFQKWENCTYGALQLEEYIKLLIKDCDKRIVDFSKTLKDNESKLERRRSEMERAQESVTKTGVIGNMFGKREDRFIEYCDTSRDYYVELARNEATKYAIALLESIKVALQDVEANIIKFSALLSLITEKAEFQSNLRCGEDDPNDAKTLRKYDKNAVSEIKEKAVKTEDTQQQIARNVRNTLVAQLGETTLKTFQQFLKTFNALEDNVDLPAENVLNIILEVCLKAAEKEVEERSQDDKRLKVTNVNILEKLRQEYDDATGEKLSEFAHELMDSAQTFIRFNQSEVSREANGNSNKRMNAVIIYLPEEKDDSGFRERLAQAFLDAKGGADKVTIAKSHRGDQLAIMTLYSMFPLRFVENLVSLKESYDRLTLMPDNKIHKLVLHTESFKEPLPSLYEATTQETANEVPKPLLLAFGMGIIREDTDSTTGRKGLYFFTRDKFGDLERSDEIVGKDFLGSVRYFASNRKEALKLKEEVKSRLESDYIHIDKKKELMDSINSILRTQILEACGNDEFGPEYKKYKKVRNEISEIELNTD